MTLGRTGRTALLAIAMAGLLSLFAGLSLWEMLDDSLTSDERVHLPAGYAYWMARDFRLNPEHPPLVKLLCAIPLLFMRVEMPPTTPDPGLSYHDYQPIFGSKFFFRQDADRILFFGRLPALVLGLALVVLMFAWSRELHGHAGAGLVTLGLAALEPTILAHSHYVTDDVGLACFSVMALYGLWRFTRGGRAWDLLIASAGTGLALATKYSAVVLLPVIFLLILVRWPAGGLRIGRRVWTGGSWRPRAAALAGAALVMALIVQGAYLFSTDPSLYLRGSEALRANRPEFNPAYVHGRFYGGMVLWYPLYAYLVKTPLPTLVVMAVAVVSCLRDRKRSREALLFLLLPAGLYTLAICALAYNYGVRYLIPLTSLLLVLAGRWFFVHRERRAGRIASALLGPWLVLSILHASPYYISYFNELIGGPANGPYFLQDSNIDWGQDLKRLAFYLKRNDVPEVSLAFWGPGQPEYYGIRWKPWTLEAGWDPPPAGVYAISVNRLVELKRRVMLGGENPRLDWLDRFTPVAIAGSSIFVYRIPGAARP